MRNVLALALLVLAGGCIEYDTVSTTAPPVKPNPADPLTPSNTDKLVQVTVPEVDILYVIDNSCSMSDEQTALSTNFPLFMAYFLGSGLDYHIGAVSTDMTDANQSGKLFSSNGVKWIDDETPNPEQVFTNIAVMGVSGSGTEKGRDAAYMGLEVRKDGYNAGFVRDDASLNIIAVSDEEDQSTDIGLNEFINWLVNLKWSVDMVSFSSIVSPGNGCDTTAGNNYLAVTEAVVDAGGGGIEWSICNEQWDSLLEQLGLQASGLKREYFLSELPVIDSIQVWVEEEGVTYTFIEGELPDGDYIYNQARNSIVFNEYVPSPLAEVYVEYDVLSALEGQL